MTETNETQNIEEIQPQEPETALQAPAGYAPEFAQSFGELPEKWQKYLCAREDEVDKGFQKLRILSGEVGKTLSEKFAARKESLKSYGVTSEEQWLKTLLDVDEYLSKDAQGAIKMLSEVYRVAPPKAFSSPAAGEGAKHSLVNALNEHLTQTLVDDFVFGRDDTGSLKHHYFKEVAEDMHRLLAGGVVKSLDEAYETALWFNAKTRDKLIAGQSQDALELKGKDAKKAREASFSPKGKAVPDTSNMSLREELEMRFAALGDDN